MGRSTEIRSSRTAGPEEAFPPTDVASFVAALERIRACLHGWLDRIEERLVEEAPPSTTGLDHEQAARALEKERDALRAEIERRDREWAERLEALEHDRRLLAEAWERLELAQTSASSTPVRSMSDSQSSGPSTAMSPAVPPRSDPENPIDRAILRQFETLRRDVRRKAKSQQIG